MARLIDAHVHIAPAHLLGRTDTRYPVTVEKYGRKRESDGRICQFMPAYMADSCFAADTLVEVLNASGVEKAVILQSHSLPINRDVADAVAAYPGRFAGAMIIEPSSEACLDDIRYWYNRGLSIIKFEMSPGLGMTHPNLYPDFDLASPLCQKIWSLAESLGITAVIDTCVIGSRGYQAEAIGQMAVNFPALHFVLCHLGFPFAGLRDDPDKYCRWLTSTGLTELKNVWFDVAALPALFRSEGYPYPSALSFLREFIDRYGSDKAIWGTDIPGTLSDATYTQMIGMFEKSLLFSEKEKEQLFSLNAEKAYF